MKKIFVIPCGASKKDYPCAAKDMYTGGYYIAIHKYILSTGYEYMIFSAKYGLLRPDDIIEPYNVSFNNKNDTHISATDIKKQFCALEADYEIFTIVGQKYLTRIKATQVTFVDYLSTNVFPLLVGKGMGYQIQYFRKAANV